MKLSGKHIFVTGGASGIGQAIVRDASAEGASVSFVDINKSAGEKLATELTAAGLNVLFAEANVADFDQLSNAFAKAVSKFGEVTGVVNNAGMAIHSDPILMTDKEWDDFFSVEMKPVWQTAKLVKPAMSNSKSGSKNNI